MKSPIYADVRLERMTLEPGFTAFRCPESHGVWFQPAHYWNWHDGYMNHTMPTQSTEGTDLVAEDSAAGKRCPEEGAVLIRHRVGHGLDFHVDRCGHCGGVWLDKHEWDALKSRGLHENLHLVFTSAWQARNKLADRDAARDRLLADKLGDTDYRKVKAMKDWIESHHKRPEIMAYLRRDYDN